MAQLQELQKQQDALTAHFVKEDRYKNEPWRREMDKAMEEYGVSEKNHNRKLNEKTSSIVCEAAHASAR